MTVHSRKTAQYVCLRLPPPISTNALYRAYARGGRVSTIKSKEYRAWISVAGAELELQKPACVPGAYGLRMALPRKTRVDFDNNVKCVADLLVAHGVVDGDSPKYMQRLEVWRGSEDALIVQIISTKGNDDGEREPDRPLQGGSRPDGNGSSASSGEDAAPGSSASSSAASITRVAK